MPLHHCTVVLPILLAGPPAATAAHPAEVEIRHIVERFQEALVAKDGTTLRALFLPHDNAWISVASDRQMELWRSRGLDPPRLEPGSHTAFIARIVAQPERVEEKFNNIKIHTDGAIASVHFGFVFLRDGQAVNRGEEAWHLVRTDEGWKISSVIYSVNRPD